MPPSTSTKRREPVDGQLDAPPPPPGPRLSPARLVLYVCVALAFLSALHGPATRCFRRAAGHLAPRTDSAEQRARKILTRHPLIGMPRALGIRLGRRLAG